MWCLITFSPFLPDLKNQHDAKNRFIGCPSELNINYWSDSLRNSPWPQQAEMA